jgi:hypothetical protein
MRVLMVNRRDAESVPGGDSVQMRETAAGLEVLGVEVVTAAVGELPSLHGFDILHVFNWDQLEPVLSSLNGCAADRPPVVLSPIFWHHSGHWFCRGGKRPHDLEGHPHKLGEFTLVPSLRELAAGQVSLASARAPAAPAPFLRRAGSAQLATRDRASAIGAAHETHPAV